MGVNKSRVANSTNRSLPFVTFNYSDWMNVWYRDYRQPDDGAEVVVNGLAGGGAVKVGVIFFMERGRVFFDLFKVRHGALLKIKGVQLNEITGGVTEYEDNAGVKLLRRRLRVKLSSDHAALASWSLGLAAALQGVAQVAQGKEPDDSFTRSVSDVLREAKLLGSACVCCVPRKPRYATPAKKKPRKPWKPASKKRPSSDEARQDLIKTTKFNSPAGSPDDWPPINQEIILVKEEVDSKFFPFPLDWDEDDENDLDTKTMITDDAPPLPDDLFVTTRTKKIPIPVKSREESHANDDYGMSLSLESTSPEIIKYNQGHVSRVWQSTSPDA